MTETKKVILKHYLNIENDGADVQGDLHRLQQLFNIFIKSELHRR